jgi:DNA repair protein SbcC/Rad50
MINSIQIRDFQSHASTDLVLSKGINAIIGESDVGKSAILRAFNWSRNNRPLGDSFIRHGQKSASVEVIKDTGSVVRERSKSINRYVLGSETYTAFGNAVPEMVVDFLDMSDINFQKQHDPYFLVFDSPGFVASYVRSCTGLSQLDEAVDKVASDIRTKKQEASRLKEEVENLSLKLKEIDQIPIENLEQILLTYDGCLKRKGTLGICQNQLSVLISKLKELQRNLIVISIDQVKEVCLRADELAIVLREKVSKRDRLESLLTKIKNLQNSKIMVSGEALSSIINDTGALEINHKRIGDRMTKLHGLVVKLSAIGVEKVRNNTELVRAEEEKKALMGSLESCPYCGVELTENSKGHLLGECK